MTVAQRLKCWLKVARDGVLDAGTHPELLELLLQLVPVWHPYHVQVVHLLGLVSDLRQPYLASSIAVLRNARRLLVVAGSNRAGRAVWL